MQLSATLALASSDLCLIEADAFLNCIVQVAPIFKHTVLENIFF